MELFDVIIVGAGPAGAAAARSLSAQGLSVLVLERHSFPRPKPCAGWVSPWTLDQIGVTPDEYADGRRTIVSFRSLVIWDGRREPREVPFDRVMGYGIIRLEFDAFLAVRMGKARLLEGVRVTDVVRGANQVVVNGQYAAPVIIGAGGHRCPVAKALGAIRPDERYVTAVVSETRPGRAVIDSLTAYPDTPQIIFNADFSGYGWYFPKGDYLNIGVGCMRAADIPRHRDSLMARLTVRGMLPDRDRDPLPRFTGHAYKLLRVTPRRASFDRVLLAGDAAGVAYNISGEGIGPAIFSGLSAARTIIESGGDYSFASLRRHSERLYSRLGRPYPEALVKGVSSSPGFLSPLLGRLASGSAVSRRLVARHWFFRD